MYLGTRSVTRESPEKELRVAARFDTNPEKCKH